MPKPSSPIRSAFKSLRSGFVAVAIFSLALNLMMLAGPLYMLQVYDRVLTSQSMETLIALSILLAGVFLVSGTLDFIRMRILSRLGARFEALSGQAVLEATMRKRVSGGAQAGDTILNDMNAYRDLIANQTLIAFFDSPWVPIYLTILFFLHPYLGILGLVGATVLFVLALINSWMSGKPIQRAAAARQQSDALFNACDSNAELIKSMGMTSSLRNRWGFLQSRANVYKTKTADRLGSFSVLSKTLRMALQSAMLGLGAALAVAGESSAGTMIAATIILGRALGPVDQAIGQWRTFVAAIGSYRKMKGLLNEYPEEEQRISLPRSAKELDISIQQAGPPRSDRATLSGVNFTLNAGDVLAVIGPSGSGKSTLARMIAGVWHPQRGSVAYDKTPTDRWDPEALGNQIGYLPQDVELFDGTIRENIERFSEAGDDQAVLRAAQLADVHDLILQLPDGYETRIGGQGHFLSGGQRQRIGLARALYGSPFVLVLDEPNSNLDATGDAALRRAVQSFRATGGITVVMTHRPSTLQAVNKALVLENGKQRAFGLKEEIFKQTTKLVSGAGKAPASVPTPANAQDQKRASQ